MFSLTEEPNKKNHLFEYYYFWMVYILFLFTNFKFFYLLFLFFGEHLFFFFLLLKFGLFGVFKNGSK